MWSHDSYNAADWLSIATDRIYRHKWHAHYTIWCSHYIFTTIYLRLPDEKSDIVRISTTSRPSDNCDYRRKNGITLYDFLCTLPDIQSDIIPISWGRGIGSKYRVVWGRLNTVRLSTTPQPSHITAIIVGKMASHYTIFHAHYQIFSLMFFRYRGVGASEVNIG